MNYLFIIFIVIVIIVWLCDRKKESEKEKSTSRLPNLQSSNDYKSTNERELLRRAELNDVEAQKHLISCYWYGHDEEISIDKATALYWKKRIINNARHGNEMARGLIGGSARVYDRPEGPPADYPFLFDEDLARNYHKQILEGANAGEASAMLPAYEYLITNKKEGFKYLLRSAELGYADSYYFLMVAYNITAYNKKLNSALCPPDEYGVEDNDVDFLFAEMFKWALKGANSNSLYADKCQYHLAQHYYAEKRDRENYLKYLKMSVNNGNLEAKDRLEWYKKHSELF